MAEPGQVVAGQARAVGQQVDDGQAIGHHGVVQPQVRQVVAERALPLKEAVIDDAPTVAAVKAFVVDPWQTSCPRCPAVPSQGARRRTGEDVPRRGEGMSTADKDRLADREFAFPEERKEPLTDARHVRNAIARFDQVEGISDAERDKAGKRIRPRRSATTSKFPSLTGENWPRAARTASASRHTSRQAGGITRA